MLSEYIYNTENTNEQIIHRFVGAINAHISGLMHISVFENVTYNFPEQHILS